jgi:hypothetical protein
MTQLSTGLIYSPELNKLCYSNDFVVNSGLNLQNIASKLGIYAEYISDEERDLLYARSIGVKIFRETKKDFDYSLLEIIDVEQEIEKLIDTHQEYADIIASEFNYIKHTAHNILLLQISFLLKRHLDRLHTNVYLMRGSGISSFIFYAIGLNKVNPLKFGLDYKNFWNN